MVEIALRGEVNMKIWDRMMLNLILEETFITIGNRQERLIPHQVPQNLDGKNGLTRRKLIGLLQKKLIGLK